MNLRAGFDFSAPDYLFVSTRVAKEFPHCLESALILSYRNHFISADHHSKWTASSRRGTVEARADLKFWRCRIISPRSFFGAMLLLGSLPQPLQVLVVSTLTPPFFGAIAVIGASLSSIPYIGIPLAFGVVMMILALYCISARFNGRSSGRLAADKAAAGQNASASRRAPQQKKKKRDAPSQSQSQSNLRASKERTRLQSIVEDANDEERPG